MRVIAGRGVCTFGVLRYGAHYDLAYLVQRFHRAIQR
ncbi:hypothetical protein FBY31_1785 [Arthrobacter sp. SLBN-100]|nr:hypothetical protein FBY31_1785 [Arthrobacter sp. SLBN-100]